MAKAVKLSNTLRRENWTNILFVLPQFSLFLTFVLIPFFASLPVAFFDYANFTSVNVKFVGLANFINIFSDPALTKFLWSSVARTFLFMLANYATVLVFGLGFALMMYELSSRVQRTFFVVIYLPYIISGLGVGMFIDLLFSQDSGSLNLLLLKLNLLADPINLKSAMGSFWALVLFVGWRYAGFNMAIFLSGLLTIPVETIEAAKMDGTNYFQRFLHVYLPQIIPSLGVATISCLVGSFGIFDETVGFGALYGNNNARLFAVILFGMGSGMPGASGKLSEGVASSVVVFIPLIILAYFIFRWQKRHQDL